MQTTYQIKAFAASSADGAALAANAYLAGLTSTDTTLIDVSQQTTFTPGGSCVITLLVKTIVIASEV